jgi:hypothetical protein
MRNRGILILVVIVLLAVGVFYSKGADTLIPRDDNLEVSNFEECVAAGFPIMESYPRQCAVNGQTFTEYIGNELEKSDLIVVSAPRPNQLVTSPMTVSGEARGNWYFEADFPIYLYDDNDNELAIGIAQAQGEWMTEDFVPFEAVLNYEQPATDSGYLVLKKSNPSGLPEQEDELIIPVRFKE